MTQPMTEAELLALPPAVDLATAGRAFGIGRTKAFELARAGKFPVKVLKVGQKYRVPRTAILEALDVRLPSNSRRSRAPPPDLPAPTSSSPSLLRSFPMPRPRRNHRPPGTHDPIRPGGSTEASS